MFIFKHDKDICAICLEEKNLPIMLICGHSFCEECIVIYMTYTEIRSKCPLCRTKLVRKRKITRWFYLKFVGFFMFSIAATFIALHTYCD